MRLVTLITSLILLQTAIAIVPPQWPQQYYVEGIFSIPYFKIVEKLKLNYDAVNNIERFDYYGDQDTYLYRYDKGFLYEIVPRINRKVCFVQNATSGPTSNGFGDTPALVTLLPDLSDWEYKGTKSIRGEMCDNWEKVVTNFNVSAKYNMFVRTRDSVPQQLYLYGYDFIFGSHPDIYIMDYFFYKPSWVNQTSFNVPDLCNSPQINKKAGYRAASVLGLVATLMPPTGPVDEFKMWAKLNNKFYPTSTEEAIRRKNWESNKKYVESRNNNPEVSHKLKMNKFGDYSHEEFREIMLPRRDALKPILHPNPLSHVRSGSKLPSYVNWVEAGAVTRPKDQGVCGSCWTFGTTGTLEGAWFLKTGHLIALSEQQIVDCAWMNWGGEGGNSGCDGGFAAPALYWIQQNGGIATEAHYKYLMQDGWCNANDKSSGVTVTGYVNVTAFSEDDLQDAVANYGPVAVAIDASHKDFTYYTSGVYYNPNCKSDPNDLDHEVLVVGYGTTEDGQDYWLVKNSWSTHWGDHGFVKMARNRNNNCGIASQATYPLV